MSTRESMSVTLETIKTVIVPQQIYEEGTAEAYLRINNLACTKDECAVVSPPVDGMVAIMAWNKIAINHLREKYLGMISFTSPLLLNMPSARPNSTMIRLSQNTASITLWKDSLKYAEILPYKSSTDIIFYMESLNRVFNIHKDEILICGHNSAGDVAKALGKYFKHTTHANYKW